MKRFLALAALAMILSAPLAQANGGIRGGVGGVSTAPPGDVLPLN
jgi:hypothetical protein